MRSPGGWAGAVVLPPTPQDGPLGPGRGEGGGGREPLGRGSLP